MIGARIREYRQSKGVKVADFAKQIGISQGSLSDIENGKTKPAAETIAAIVRNTDIDATWLLTGEGKPPETARQLSPRTAALVDNFEALGEEDKRAFERLVSTVAESEMRIKKNTG